MRLHATLFRFVNRLKRQQKRAVFLGVDMTVGPLLAILVLLPKAGSFPADVWFMLPGLIGISAVASMYMGLPRIKLNEYEIHAVLATAKFAFVTTLGFAGLCLAMDFPLGGRPVAAFLTALLCGTVASRFILLAALRWVLRKGQQRRRTLIYGAGETGLQVAAALRNMPQVQILAFLDDNVDLQAMTVGGLPVLAPGGVAPIVEKLRIEQVYLAMPSLTQRKTLAITKALQSLGVEVHHLSAFSLLARHDTAQKASLANLPGAILGRSTTGSDLPKMDMAYAGQTLLVSGAGGSVGSELCRQLLSYHPKRLVLYERSELALYTIERELRDHCVDLGTEIVPVLGSVADLLLAKSTMIKFGVNVVFHAAAYKHVPMVEANPIAGLSNNVIGTRIFADAALSASVDRFVLVSTDKAVRPKSVMGGTKRLAELLIQDLAKRSQRTQFSIVRFGNVLGSSGSVLPRFREQIAQGGPITLTDENVTRYFMTITEAVHLVLVAGAFCAADDLLQANVFVLDMGQPVRIRDLAERLVTAAGLSICDAANPDGDIEIAVTGLRPGEKLHEELFIDRQFLATPHPKILRAQERSLSEFEMASALNSTRRAIATADQAAARQVLQTWVEGFPGGSAAAIECVV